ncbi:hypothetical protein EGC77_15780 [Shewanella psychromarinicola]|uniref:Uncharacterized protein n=1 Tax=Shewanella psychromarinicola TaxID=2487742 RepID=A0A3N4EF13_9GAMM|nr:hypothetical protein EGC77_15780 [Shewanella psychromarinicola]
MYIEQVAKELERLSNAVDSGFFDDAREGTENLHERIIDGLDRNATPLCQDCCHPLKSSNN